MYHVDKASNLNTLINKECRQRYLHSQEHLGRWNAESVCGKANSYDGIFEFVSVSLEGAQDWMGSLWSEVAEKFCRHDCYEDWSWRLVPILYRKMPHELKPAFDSPVDNDSELS